jgi:hypothetical protein
MVITDDLCYPTHLTPFQPYFDPVRVGERAGQDLLHDTPCLFVVALILFPDNIYGKPNPDRAPLPSIPVWFHDLGFPTGALNLNY